MSELNIGPSSADSVNAPGNEKKEENRKPAKRTAEQKQKQKELAKKILGFVDDLSSESDDDILIISESNDLEDVQPPRKDVIVPVPIELSTAKKFGVSIPSAAGTKLAKFTEAIPLPKKRQLKKPLVRKVAKIAAQTSVASTATEASAAAKQLTVPIEIASTSTNIPKKSLSIERQPVPDAPRSQLAISVELLQADQEKRRIEEERRNAARKRETERIEKRVCYVPVDPNRQPSPDIFKFNHSQATPYLNQPPQQQFPPPQHFAPNQFAPPRAAQQQHFGPRQNFGPRHRSGPPPQRFGSPQQFEPPQFRAPFHQPQISINTDRPVNIHFNCAPGGFPYPWIKGNHQNKPKFCRGTQQRQKKKRLEERSEGAKNAKPRPKKTAPKAAKK